MNRAVRIDRHGGPEEMKITEVSVGEPGPGEIRIRHKAVGLNFIDVYQRTGLYPLPMPAFMVGLLFGQMGRETLLGDLAATPAKALAAGFVFETPDLPSALQAALRE